MTLKQFKEIISKFPDETEIFVINDALDICKPNDDLFFLESPSTNGLVLMIEHYKDEAFNLFDSKDKNDKYTGSIWAVDPTTGKQYPDTDNTIIYKMEEGEWKVFNNK